MSKVLVTGVSGFVGAHLAKRLFERGNTVWGLTRDYSSPSSLSALGIDGKINISWADVRDLESMTRIIRQREIETVYHLAAVSTVSEAQKNPIDAFDVNVMGTVKLLTACKDSTVQKVIIASSDKVYGDSDGIYKDNSPLLGIEIYPASKVAEDVAARSFARTYGMNVAVVRPSNIYGPGDLDTTRVIPGNIIKMLQGRPATLYKHANNMIRQFVYIDDVIDAYLTVSQNCTPGSVWNVGGYETSGVSIGDIVREIAAMMGGVVEVLPSSLKEIQNQFLDDSTLRMHGWSPRVCLHNGLIRTIAWYKQWLAP